jgi:tRNA U34 5-methylaminomethyl-2-thiouridine-forming methyltransferase MnmC
MSLRCIVTDANGKQAVSNPAVLTYKYPFYIYHQPISGSSYVVVNANESAELEVGVEGRGLKYLWQYKEAEKTAWTDWTTKTTAKINIAYAPYRDGMSFRCKVTNSDGEVLYSNEAILQYLSKFEITKQPSSVTVDPGTAATFNVTATGNGLKYLWQYKKADESTWTNWTSKTTAAISVAYADFRNGMSLRCIVTDSTGEELVSNVATLTYNIPLSITKQPANTTVDVNTLASFSVTAAGKGLKYLWQYKKAGESTWTNWTSKTTATISVAYADYRDGMSFRCVVTDSTGKSVTSNAATLTYNKPLAITKQPANTTVDVNTLASFSVTATGKGLKYLWQYKKAGESIWTNWTSKTTAAISVAYADYRDGMSFRCVVTDSTGKSVTSNTATLTYNKLFAITKQPTSASVSTQSVASFSVTATGKGLKYQWQYKNAGDSDWTTWSSKTTASITVAYADYRNGMSLRCVITDESNQKLTTNTVTLTYK